MLSFNDPSNPFISKMLTLKRNFFCLIKNQKTKDEDLYCIENIELTFLSKAQVTNCTLCIPDYKLVRNLNQCMTFKQECQSTGCLACYCDGSCDKDCDSPEDKSGKCTEGCLICDENYWPSSVTANTCTQDTSDVSLQLANCLQHRTTGVCYKCKINYVLAFDESNCLQINYVYPLKLIDCRIFASTLQDSCAECIPGYYQKDPINNSFCSLLDGGTNFEVASKYLTGFAPQNYNLWNLPSYEISYELQQMLDTSAADITCHGCLIYNDWRFSENRATYLKICWDRKCLAQLNNFRVDHDAIIYVQFAALTTHNIFQTEQPLNDPLCQYYQTRETMIIFPQNECKVESATYGTGIAGYQITINQKAINSSTSERYTSIIRYQITLNYSMYSLNSSFTQVSNNIYRAWTFQQWWDFYGGFIFVMNILVPTFTSLIFIGVCMWNIRNIYRKIEGFN